MVNIEQGKSCKDLIGKVFETNNCGKCVIVDYLNSKNVIVEFVQYPCRVRCTLSWLKHGKVLNPMFPKVCGIGYIGLGVKPSQHSVAYKAWSNMLTRAYCEEFKRNNPTYADVTVCEEWHNFQNFVKWCQLQVGFNNRDENGLAYHLDKDILLRGNNIYSPETCCFVPRVINNLLIKKGSSSGKNHLGVHFVTKKGKFKASYRKGGVSKHLGYFDDPDEAFLAYKKAKELHVKEVAEEWKGAIDVRTYQALMRWEVISAG